MEYKLKTKPISIHDNYRMGKNRYFISDLGKRYKQNIIDEILKYQNKLLFNCPVKLTIYFGFSDYRPHDLDNYCKPLLDALKGIIYDDDKLIFELHCFKYLGQNENFIKIIIMPLNE